MGATEDLAIDQGECLTNELLKAADVEGPSIKPVNPDPATVETTFVAAEIIRTLIFI